MQKTWTNLVTTSGLISIGAIGNGFSSQDCGFTRKLGECTTALASNTISLDQDWKRSLHASQQKKLVQNFSSLDLNPINRHGKDFFMKQDSTYQSMQ